MKLSLTTYKLALFVASAFVIIGCSDIKRNDTDPRYRVVKVESEIKEGGKTPYATLTYNDDNRLIASETNYYAMLSNGKTELLASHTCRYQYNGEEVNLTGTRIFIDSVSGESTQTNIDIKLIFDKQHRIRKRIDYNNMYRKDVPYIEIFEWKGNKIVRKTGKLEGEITNGVFEIIADYMYENNNLLQSITQTKIDADERRTVSNDTIRFAYEAGEENHLSDMFPDEYELSYSNTAYFPVRYSEKQISAISQQTLTTCNVDKQGEIYRITASFHSDLSYTRDKQNRILTRSDNILLSSQFVYAEPDKSQSGAENIPQQKNNFTTLYYTYQQNESN